MFVLYENKSFILPHGAEIDRSRLASSVSTDEIYPVRYSNIADDFGQAALTGFRTQKIALGELQGLNCNRLVMGENAGCGSAREHAAVCLYDAGIRLVCALTFNATFRRNLINCGCIPTTDFSLLFRKKVCADDVPDLSAYERQILKHGGLLNAPPPIPAQHQAQGMTMTEKIISRAAGLESACAGDVVTVSPDVVFTYDVHIPLVRRALAGVTRLTHPCILAFNDHFPDNPKYKRINQMLYDFTEEYGVTSHFLDSDSGGVCHSVIRDNYAAPGKLIVGTDSHTATCGVCGALGLAVGATEAAAAMKNGCFALTVPETVKVSFVGELDAGCAIKDVVLYLLGTDFVRGGKTLGRILEFDLSPLRDRSVDELTVLCNMAIEVGAWGGIAVPAIFDPAISPDKNACYTASLNIDLSKIVPAVALPHHPGNYMPLADLCEAVPIQKVFIGSCTGGLLHDIQLAADLLRGNVVASSVKLYVQPSSNTIYTQAEAQGWLEIIRKAGGIILKPACGGCIGQGQAAIGDDENGVWNSNRNFQGRLGSPKGNVYIAGTKTAILTAIRGTIN